MRFFVVIPALNPDQQLIDYVNKLFAIGVTRIFIVNDGSDHTCENIFRSLDSIHNCKVLHHPHNMGKGVALKTAFRHLLATKYETYHAVITADADGQHSVNDIEKMLGHLRQNSPQFTLGARNFNSDIVPFRSVLGNKVTNFFFQCFYRRKLQDTQTGLRAIPTNLLPSIAKVAGRGYEYEMNMIIYLVKRKIPIQELSIETLYFNQNKGSHFNPLIDSIKVLIRLFIGVFQRPIH